MNTSTQLGNISMSKKAKNRGLKVKYNYLIYSEMRYKLCFNGYTWINRSHKTLLREASPSQY